MGHTNHHEIKDRLLLLVCGSRDYPDEASVQRCLAMVIPYKAVYVLHGACPTGADRMAHRFLLSVEHPSLTIHTFPADWNRHGKAAGPIRNQEMVKYAVANKEPGTRLACMAFWDGESRGTLDCLRKAVKAGIETAVVPPDPYRETEENPYMRINTAQYKDPTRV